MKKSRSTLLIIALLAIVAFVFYKYRQPRFVAGEQAPDFEVGLLNGERAKLSDLKGKYVLLQFWGSWCGPCRKENPELVALYEQYHDKGFEIFSVALEQNPRAWQNAIKQDGMIWKYHTMESAEFNGGRAQQFNVHQIPTIFLINADGLIMGVDLKPDYMNKMLREKLGSK
jgi:thiol-disulfide isomerase/thioredoxin